MLAQTALAFTLPGALVFGLSGLLYSRLFGPMNRIAAIVLAALVWAASWVLGAFALGAVITLDGYTAARAANTGVLVAFIPTVLFFLAVRRRRPKIQATRHAE